MSQLSNPFKFLFAAILSLILSFATIGCDGEDGETGPQGPAGDPSELTLLVTLNLPMEWAGGSRMGSLFEALDTTQNAAQSEEFANVIVYFGPEASHYTGESPDYPTEPHLDDLANVMSEEEDTLGDLARRLSDEYGVVFLCSAAAAGQHQITLLDFFVPVWPEQYTTYLADANRIVGY
jgi:hypothetical protein